MRTKILFTLVVLVLFAGSAMAQENAARKVEIGWLPGYMRADGGNFYTAGVDLAVALTDSVAAVGEYRGAIPSLNSSSSVLTYRGGVRFRHPSGNRIATFVQGVAGGANISAGGPSGFSFAAGGGVDIALRNWLAFRPVQVSYDMFRFEGDTTNAFRITTGLVFRIGSREE